MAHLTLSQRQQIAQGIQAGKSNACIARELCVSPSTVGREIARNGETRESYAAGLAHTMAASRQILATRQRFRCAAEVYRPTSSQFRFSPYFDLCIPALKSWQPPMLYHKLSLSSSIFYFNPKEDYLVFTRFDKISGMIRPSGERILPVTMRWDCRIREAHDSSSSFQCFDKKPSSLARPGRTYFSFERNIPEIPATVQNELAQQTASMEPVCTFEIPSSQETDHSVKIPAKTKVMALPAKSWEGGSLPFAA